MEHIVAFGIIEPVWHGNPEQGEADGLQDGHGSGLFWPEGKLAAIKNDGEEACGT